MYKRTSIGFKATTLMQYILHCTENYQPPSYVTGTYQNQKILLKTEILH